MRIFSLASQEARKNVDLTDYETLITGTVLSIIPNAKVKVHKHFYTIDHVTKGESIKIGKVLSRSCNLGKYCIKISKLFSGTEADEEMTFNNTENDAKGA